MVYKKNKKNSKIKILDDDDDDNNDEDQEEIEESNIFPLPEKQRGVLLSIVILLY